MTNDIYSKEQILKTIKDQGFSSLERTKLETLAANLHLQLVEANDFIIFATETVRHQEILINKHKSDLNRIVKGESASGLIGASYKIGKSNQKTESAKNSVQRKLARDPKQLEKKFVKECWDDWQKSPEKYKSAAKFAIDMINKCTEIESTKNIENWCSKWKSELKT